MKNKSLIEKLHETASNYNKEKVETLTIFIKNLMEEAASKGEFFVDVILGYENRPYIPNVIDYFEDLGFKVSYKEAMTKGPITIDWRRLPKNK